jgi:hypothetical protein
VEVHTVEVPSILLKGRKCIGHGLKRVDHSARKLLAHEEGGLSNICDHIEHNAACCANFKKTLKIERPIYACRNIARTLDVPTACKQGILKEGLERHSPSFVDTTCRDLTPLINRTPTDNLRKVVGLGTPWAILYPQKNTDHSTLARSFNRKNGFSSL